MVDVPFEHRLRRIAGIIVNGHGVAYRIGGCDAIGASFASPIVIPHPSTPIATIDDTINRVFVSDFVSVRVTFLILLKYDLR